MAHFVFSGDWFTKCRYNWEETYFFFPSALSKNNKKKQQKKPDQGTLCSTTEIIGFKTFLKLFCSEIISAWIAFRFWLHSLSCLPQIFLEVKKKNPKSNKRIETRNSCHSHFLWGTTVRPFSLKKLIDHWPWLLLHILSSMALTLLLSPVLPFSLRGLDLTGFQQYFFLLSVFEFCLSW